MKNNELEKKTVVQEVKELLNVSYVKKTILIGTELFGALSPFLEEPTFWNGLKGAFEVGKIFVSEFEIWSGDYFMDDKWSPPYPVELNHLILKAISSFPHQTIRTSDEINVVKIHNVNGVKFGYTFNTKLNSIERIFVETEHLDKARDLARNMLWNMFKDVNLVMRQNKRQAHQLGDEKICFESDDAFHPISSERASQYATYLKRCISTGVYRSVLLYGPPGTGKSTMARTIVDNLKMRSFRIRVEDISDFENTLLFETINIFQPDAIILDDFDRSMSQAQLLETLEFFQRHVKLVIATANDRNNLSEAILRPGRFDELIFISKMDVDVVKMVLGPNLQDAFEIVKDWPIAFINEYVKRRKFMSSDEAAQATQELALRVKRLSKYEDIDDVELMSRLAKQRKNMNHESHLKDDSDEPIPDTDPPSSLCDDDEDENDSSYKFV